MESSRKFPSIKEKKKRLKMGDPFYSGGEDSSEKIS